MLNSIWWNIGSCLQKYQISNALEMKEYITYHISIYIQFNLYNSIYTYIRTYVNIRILYIVPGARVRPPTNYWVSYQPTIGYLTNQLLGILPTNYWVSVSYQPAIGYLTNQFTTFLLSIFPPPLATHAFNDSGSSTTFLLSMFPPPLATHV